MNVCRGQDLIHVAADAAAAGTSSAAPRVNIFFCYCLDHFPYERSLPSGLFYRFQLNLGFCVLDISWNQSYKGPLGYKGILDTVTRVDITWYPDGPIRKATKASPNEPKQIWLLKILLCFFAFSSNQVQYNSLGKSVPADLMCHHIVLIAT